MGSSEVSQLCEMNAELSSCKENNDRTRKEISDIRVMIGLQEKRLESQVSVTNRHRSGKAAATAAVEKRVQGLFDLRLKVDHIAKQHNEVHQQRMKRAAAGVQQHQEGRATEVPHELRVELERLERLVAKEIETKKREEQTRNLPATNLAKENEAAELASRSEELDAEIRVQREERATAETACTSSTTLIQDLGRVTPEVLDQIETSHQNHEQNVLEMKEARAEVEEAERADHELAVVDGNQQKSLNSDIHAEEARLAQLAVEDTHLTTVEEEQAESAQTTQALVEEMKAITHESMQDDPKVLGMRALLQEKFQKTRLLLEQRKKDDEVFATHGVNEPDFGDRKKEHQALTSKTDAIRQVGTTWISAHASTEARKAAHEEEKRRVAEETAAEKASIEADILSEDNEHARVVAECKETSAAVADKELLVAAKKAEHACSEAMRTDVMASLARSCELEHEFNSRMSGDDPDHNRDMSEYQAQAMKVKAEEEATRRAAQDLEEELRVKKAKAKEDRRKRAEADKHKLFADSLASRTREMMAALETSRNEELLKMQQEASPKHGQIITAEDNKFRDAWAEANQAALGGGGVGVEERLLEELASLQAQKAAELPDVDSIESNNKRRENDRYHSW
ncbi:unnamed protein product [Ectocarpus sp. 12 AP-2014]